MAKTNADLRTEALRAVETEDWQKARELLYLVLKPGTGFERDVSLWRSFAHACGATSNLGQAIDAYRAALRLDPSDLPSLQGLAWCYFTQVVRHTSYSAEQRSAAARAGLVHFRELTRRDNEDVAAWEALGMLAAREGEVAEAGDAFRAAIRLDPSRTGTWASLGEIYLRQRKGDAALTVYNRLRSMNEEGAADSAERLRRCAEEQGLPLDRE